MLCQSIYEKFQHLIKKGSRTLLTGVPPHTKLNRGKYLPKHWQHKKNHKSHWLLVLYFIAHCLCDLICGRQRKKNTYRIIIFQQYYLWMCFFFEILKLANWLIYGNSRSKKLINEKLKKKNVDDGINTALDWVVLSIFFSRRTKINLVIVFSSCFLCLCFDIFSAHLRKIVSTMDNIEIIHIM